VDDDPRTVTYRFLHEVLSAEGRALDDETRALDTKAALLAGFAAAAVSFLLDRPGGALWWCALLAHGCALGLSLAVLWPRRVGWTAARRLHDRLRDERPETALAAVLRFQARSLERASWRIGAARALWCAAVAILVVGLVLTVWTALAEVVT